MKQSRKRVHMRKLIRALLCMLAFALVLTSSATAETLSNSKAEIDVNTFSEGVIRVRSLMGKTKSCKVRIQKDGFTYTYDLNRSGAWDVYPLQLGNGNYKITVFEQVRGSSYAVAFFTNASVKLTDPNAPFLHASKIVDYNEDSKAVIKAKEICKDLISDKDKVGAIYSYVIKNFKYDTKKANAVINGTLTSYSPILDSVYEEKKGICFDYSALLAAMLRSVGVPCKTIMGYVSPKDLYHAWNEVYIKNEGWVTKIIYFDGKKWNLMDPTFGASKSEKSVLKFIGKSENYKKQYTY